MLYVVILRTYSVIRAVTLILQLYANDLPARAERQIHSSKKKNTKDKWRITETYITKHILN